jgi:hypothetical protein
MKIIMFNGLDWPFEFLNLRYGRETREVLCFAKNHILSLSLSLSLSINIYMSEAMVLREAQNLPCFASVSRI